MRVLTVRQPWAWAIIHGGKDVENRVRTLGPYRGPVAIHAGRGWSEHACQGWAMRTAVQSSELGYPADDSQTWAADSIERDDKRFVFGAVIGVVDLIGVHDSQDCYDADLRRLAELAREDHPAFQAIPDAGGGGLIGRVRRCSPWAMDEHHHLMLENPRPIEPIPATGRLGLWRPAAGVIDQMQGALA
ncbi:hypothetical protein HMPREF0063_10091 [Aeromicrobium marinum DSM 15272]|uniref:ASCH domain-containing protein n=1 Tax=Aeromicrobium marinum DSM 15272 TaxID=585531 RepID=E2S7T4_9ACTN|nr:hypothetical protein [Aeromicrobium marinum]EFQ84750.1 hypothetical protein HMPREF0063_10091 [Aeromicrobium marinum DSM 15272]